MNPTVSERSALRRDWSATERTVGSSVAHIRAEAAVRAPVKALNKVDLPAFVYPTSATVKKS